MEHRYYIDGVKVTQAEAEEAAEMNALYMYQAEQGNFAALSKVVFIVKLKK